MANGTIQKMGATFDLLWTNPSPTSTFAAQTIPLDLSGYDAVMVEYLAANSSTMRVPAILMVGTDGAPTQKSSDTASVFGRRTYVSTSGCEFAAGYSGSTQNNLYAIPTRIWGIKGIPT